MGGPSSVMNFADETIDALPKQNDMHAMMEVDYLCLVPRVAMREPEKYRDLKIRIGGWAAFFVDLPPAYQEWQIKKYEQHEG